MDKSIGGDKECGIIEGKEHMAPLNKKHYEEDCSPWWDGSRNRVSRLELPDDTY